MGRKYLTGDDDIEAVLKNLSDAIADRIAKSALGAALTVVNKEIKKAAPHGATGITANSIGKRFEKNKRKGVVTAKTGIGVGKTKKGQVRLNAPHAHLVALGSKARKRKSIGGRFSYIKRPSDSQLSTGVMPANPFVKEAYLRARGATMKAAMIKRAEKALAREVIKAAKRNRSN